MEITCYDIYDRIEGVTLTPSSPKRDWMDKTPDRFAYRCLPLVIANQDGWDVRTEIGCWVWWNGGKAVEDLTVQGDNGQRLSGIVSHFGSGILTVTLPWLFQTPEGIALRVGGPPNEPLDGLYPLEGIVETFWLPFTFTMNWLVRKVNEWVYIPAGFPVCHISVVGAAWDAEIHTKYLSLSLNPQLQATYQAWSTSRSQFAQAIKQPDTPERKEGWQKHYTRGAGQPDHKTRRPYPPFVREDGA